MDWVDVRGHRRHIFATRPARPFGESGPFELGGGATHLREFGVLPEAGSAPAKFEPSGANSAFQFVVPDEWPKWGDGGYDLYMGGSGALGFTGSCYMGSTYAPNNICGGDGSWDWGACSAWPSFFVTAAQSK